MDNIKSKHAVGDLKISLDVIAAIARVATLEIEGVDSIVEQVDIYGFFSRPAMRKAIKININDDFANIEISVNLKYGAKISEVCAAIQNNVKDNVQTMTGMAVSKVNVLVAGIAFPEDNSLNLDK